jgi:hypothetical protein
MMSWYLIVRARALLVSHLKYRSLDVNSRGTIYTASYTVWYGNLVELFFLILKFSSRDLYFFQTWMGFVRTFRDLSHGI